MLLKIIENIIFVNQKFNFSLMVDLLKAMVKDFQNKRVYKVLQ